MNQIDAIENDIIPAAPHGIVELRDEFLGTVSGGWPKWLSSAVSAVGSAAKSVFNNVIKPGAKYVGLAALAAFGGAIGKAGYEKTREMLTPKPTAADVEGPNCCS